MAGLCIVSCRNGLGYISIKMQLTGSRELMRFVAESFERYLQSGDTINYTEDMEVRKNGVIIKEHMAPALYSAIKTYINRNRLRRNT